MVLVSVFQPAAATDTVIVCSPGLMPCTSIGVTLPVSTPSIDTLAPSGNEVMTTSWPSSTTVCARIAAGAGSKQTAITKKSILRG
jgi:hypothetical protein